jgi:hypothetical protein
MENEFALRAMGVGVCDDRAADPAVQRGRIWRAGMCLRLCQEAGRNSSRGRIANLNRGWCVQLCRPRLSECLWCRRVAPQRVTDSPPIEIKIPEGDKRSEYMQVMCDLTVLAFQTDTTRVSTYIGSTPNGVSYPELGFRGEHHSYTHHGNDPDPKSKVAAITAFNISQFAYMVKKMASLKEGDGTLLDHCIMLWGSGLEDGDKHSRENLPFIIAGKGGGSLKTGQFISDIKGNQGDLLSTLLACMGVPLDRPIGIATKQIKEMTTIL